MAMAIEDENSNELGNWMTDLPMHIKDQPLIYLAIPGSHNTFSYSISKNSRVSPDAPHIVQTLSNFAKPIVNPFIFKWSLTQYYDIIEQLNKGIRYLDIRVVCYSGITFVCHGLYGGSLCPYLDQISLFLTRNKGEVLILDFQHFYNFSLQDHYNLISTIHVIFGERLCYVTNIKDLTLNNLVSSGKQVIVVYRNYLQLSYTFLWPSSTWPTPWPDMLKIKKLENFLNSTLQNRNNDMGIVSQCLLTVDTSYVIKHPCLNLKTMALRTNSKISNWLKFQHSGPNGVNVIICDFIEDNNFIKNVIEINMKQMYKK